MSCDADHAGNGRAWEMASQSQKGFLVVSLYVNNAFIVLLFPSVLCEFINAVSTWIPVKYRYIKGAAPWRLFRIDQVAINYWQSYVIFICVVLLFDLVIYVWRGVKNDAL